jgi:integrase
MSQARQPQKAPADTKELNMTFDFASALPARTSSVHTQRAYFRWVDTFLVDMAGFVKMTGNPRLERMHSLPVATLNDVLTIAHLRTWLGILTKRQHSKTGIEQARAAIITLADLVAEAGWLDKYEAATMNRVKAPYTETGQPSGRWLAPEDIIALIKAAKGIAANENQELRNNVVVHMLCTMVMRHNELARAKWGDLTLRNNQAVLRVSNRGRKITHVDVPETVLYALHEWRTVIAPGELHPPPHTPLIRRIWKGGKVAQNGLTPDGIWHIIDNAAVQAGLETFSPHDLRRSVAGALHQAGLSSEKISRLLPASRLKK